MAQHKELYGLQPGRGYSSGIPAVATSALNQREKDCLDVLRASLRVARLANQFMSSGVAGKKPREMTQEEKSHFTFFIYY